ncbi:hypothetical protein F2P56_033397 [Juglans regia]|uniref:Uncharacterized protein LOC109018336 n=2 Tax=Juglans regia TaxID=51240 RepID=A0A2I4HIP5_JUGRE|nr:uncharacterized protein LOC109018336 [Juglans regia]KAF5447880.1 hypothetical protein F2P56_033397 [Juglans regia]
MGKRRIQEIVKVKSSFVRILEEKCSMTSNLVEFYKDVCWSNKKGKFMTEEAKEIYKSMVGKFNDIEPEQQTTYATRSVFREVLGALVGYAKGLKEMVIPKIARVTEHECNKQYAEAMGRHKKEAEH